MKRGEKICVGSMVVFIITGYIGVGLAFSMLGGVNVPHFVMDILAWISFLSLIPICGFICSRILDYPDAREREARRQIRLESPRVLMPDMNETLEDPEG